jgi:hypothetical protein
MNSWKLPLAEVLPILHALSIDSSPVHLNRTW